MPHLPQDRASSGLTLLSRLRVLQRHLCYVRKENARCEKVQTVNCMNDYYFLNQDIRYKWTIVRMYRWFTLCVWFVLFLFTYWYCILYIIIIVLTIQCTGFYVYCLVVSQVNSIGIKMNAEYDEAVVSIDGCSYLLQTCSIVSQSQLSSMAITSFLEVPVLGRIHLDTCSSL